MERLKLLSVVTMIGVALVGCSRNSEAPSTSANPPAVSQNARDAELEAHKAEATVERISISNAQAAVQEGEAVFVDVRQASAYQTGHIAGAQSLPEAEIPTRASLLPKGKKIIAYCS